MVPNRLPRNVGEGGGSVVGGGSPGCDGYRKVRVGMDGVGGGLNPDVSGTRLLRCGGR